MRLNLQYLIIDHIDLRTSLILISTRKRKYSLGTLHIEYKPQTIHGNNQVCLSISDTPFCYIMRMFVMCCHGEIM